MGETGGATSNQRARGHGFRAAFVVSVPVRGPFPLPRLLMQQRHLPWALAYQIQMQTSLAVTYMSHTSRTENIEFRYSSTGVDLYKFIINIYIQRLIRFLNEDTTLNSRNNQKHMEFDSVDSNHEHR